MADCRGKPIRTFNRIEGNYFAYAGDKDLTVVIYKYSAKILVDKKAVCVYWRCVKADESDINIYVPLIDIFWMRKSVRFNAGGTTIRIKDIGKACGVYHMSFYYKGDYYDIVYGYGIDPDMRLWNKIKNEYYVKADARKITNLYNRIKSRSNIYKTNGEYLYEQEGNL